MASDVQLVVVEPVAAVVVAVRWIGMGRAVLACQDVLDRAPTQHAQGYQVWDHVGVEEVLRIVAGIRYADGLTATEVAALAKAFPPPRCWWSIERDY